MMKSGLILTFKMYKMAETGLQLLQAGTDPLISMKSLQFSAERSWAYN